MMLYGASMKKTLQAYRFALDRTAVQDRGAYAHAGAARVAHNWARARVPAVPEQRDGRPRHGCGW
jgi:hypothetical protein